MASYADIRTLPGLYGGGFARVIEVQALDTRRSQGGAGDKDALVRLQRLRDPLSSFGETLKSFTTDKAAQPQQTPRLSSSALTLLQQIETGAPLGPQLPPIGPQLPPLGETTDRPDQPVRADKEETDANKSDNAKQDEKTAAAFTGVNKTSQTKEPFGPDFVAQLEKAMKKVPIQLDPQIQINPNALFGGPSALLAAQSTLAAKAYAATLTGSSNQPETTLTA